MVASTKPAAVDLVPLFWLWHFSTLLYWEVFVVLILRVDLAAWRRGDFQCAAGSLSPALVCIKGQTLYFPDCSVVATETSEAGEAGGGLAGSHSVLVVSLVGCRSL